MSRKSMLFLLMGGISQNFERGTKVEEERSVAPLQPRLETMQIKNELELEKQQYG